MATEFTDYFLILNNPTPTHLQYNKYHDYQLLKTNCRKKTKDISGKTNPGLLRRDRTLTNSLRIP